MLSSNVNRTTSEHCFGVKSLLPTTHSRTGQQYLTTGISTGKPNYFQTLIILMRHNVQDTLTVTDQPMSHTAFQSTQKSQNMASSSVYWKCPHDKVNPDDDRSWKIIRIFDYLNNAHITPYHPTENLGVD